MSRDLALYFSNKLASEWSASSVTGLLSPAVVEDISTTQKWEALDPLVRVRLLLAPMFLRRQELAEIQPALTTLKSVVEKDSDEWVRVIAAAVGPYDGVLHMDAVLEHSKLVKSTMEELKRHGAGANPTIFRPLEEKYLSTAVLEKRLPGSSVERKHIPEHTHFILRDAAKAPGNSISIIPPAKVGVGCGGGPSSAAGAAGASNLSRPTSAGVALPRSSSGLLQGKPPMGPSRLAAPGGGGVLGSGGARGGGGASRFLPPGGKPGVLGPGLTGRAGGGGLSARASGSAALGSANKAAFKEKKKAAIIDINAVAQLNQAAALEKERKQREDEEERETAALAKIEAKRMEKEAEKEKKKREIARAAAAKDAEKEAEKARKEAEALAAKEAKEAAKEVERLRKEEAARKKAEEQAEKEAQRAQREAERAEKERAKAARAELKRAAAAAAATGEHSGGLDQQRPAKVSKKNAGATATTSAATSGMAVLPAALSTYAQQVTNTAILQPGTRPGEAPVVQLVDPQVALAALREAGAMGQGAYGDFTLLQQQQEEEDEEDELQRYIEMGRAAAAAAEMQRKEDEQQQQK